MGQHTSLPTGLVLAWKGEYADEGINKLVLALAYSVHALKNVRKARIRGATFTYQPMLARWMLEFVACDHGGWTRWSKAWSSDDLGIPYGREPWLHALVAAAQGEGLGAYQSFSLSTHTPAPPSVEAHPPNTALGVDARSPEPPQVGELWRMPYSGESALVWNIEKNGTLFGTLRATEEHEVVFSSFSLQNVNEGTARKECERNPDGGINNCARQFGLPATECQLCGGFCPDHPEEWEEVAKVRKTKKENA
jgi:hypothetical protein